jgi:hypothetical protein
MQNDPVAKGSDHFDEKQYSRGERETQEVTMCWGKGELRSRRNFPVPPLIGGRKLHEIDVERAKRLAPSGSFL